MHVHGRKVYVYLRDVMCVYGCVVYVYGYAEYVYGCHVYVYRYGVYMYSCDVRACVRTCVCACRVK